MTAAYEPIPNTARPFRVDRAGRLTLPKELRAALEADGGGLYGWWDGVRLHLASLKDMQETIDRDVKESRAKSKRKKG